MSDGSLFNLDEVAPLAQPAATSQATSLYRKYRPQSFAADDLFGQEHVVQTLRNAIALNRIAHAYLFCGPRGTGKTTTARLMAKAVNCLHPDPYQRPCNECDACVAINTNATTDIIEIDAASNRGIDDIRDLRERVKYAPSQLRTKFYIIDEAHQITGAAANAFLKTLEEPPPHTKFILATTDPEELLPTIVSRCQRFDFRRIGLDAMTACLRKVADLESIPIDEPALDAIARHATGSLRDGLGILDQVSLYREQGSDEATVTLELVQQVLGISRNERVESLVRSIANRNTATALEAIGTAIDEGDDVRQLARQLLSYVRMLMLERAGGSKDADATARELANLFELSELASAAQRLSDLDFRIKHAILPQLPLELAMVELTRKPSTPQSVPSQTPDRQSTPPQRAEAPVAAAPARGRLQDRVRKADPKPEPARIPAAAKSEASHTTTPTPQPQEHVVANSGSASIDAIIDMWQRIRTDVKAVDRRTEAVMQQVDPVFIDGNQLVLATSYSFHQNKMNTDETRRVVEDVVSRLTGTRMTVTTISRDDVRTRQARATTPAATPSAPDTAEHVDPETPEPEEQVAPQLTEDDEIRLRAVRNIFDAEEVTD